MACSRNLYLRLVTGNVRCHRWPQHRISGSRTIGHCSDRCSLQHYIWKKTARLIIIDHLIKIKFQTKSHFYKWDLLFDRLINSKYYGR